MGEISIVNWAEPSAFLALQVPAFGLALWLAWKLARSYVASTYKAGRMSADFWVMGYRSKALRASLKAIFYSLAAWVCCAGFLGVGAGLLGLDPASNLTAWQLGGAALLPLVAVAERHLAAGES